MTEKLPGLAPGFFMAGALLFSNLQENHTAKYLQEICTEFEQTSKFYTGKMRFCKKSILPLLPAA